MKNITNTHQEHPITLEDTIGRDPREFTREVWEDLESELQPMKAIRAKCIECCGGYRSEVPKCQGVHFTHFGWAIDHKLRPRGGQETLDTRVQLLKSQEIAADLCGKVVLVR